MALTEFLKTKGFTDERIETIDYVCQGYTYKEIALIRGCSVKNIKCLVSHTIKQLDLSNRIELILYLIPYLDIEQIKRRFHDDV